MSAFKVWLTVMLIPAGAVAVVFLSILANGNPITAQDLTVFGSGLLLVGIMLILYMVGAKGMAAAIFAGVAGAWGMFVVAPTIIESDMRLLFQGGAVVLWILGLYELFKG